MLGDSNIYPTIAVKDIEKAKEFYGSTLGLEVKDENPGGVSYKCDDGSIFIYESEYAGSNKATYAGWSVKDIEGVVSDLKSKGVQFEHYEDMPHTTLEGDLHVMEGMPMKMAWFKDPDGNILAIDNMA